MVTRLPTCAVSGDSGAMKVSALMLPQGSAVQVIEKETPASIEPFDTVAAMDTESPIATVAAAADTATAIGLTVVEIVTAAVANCRESATDVALTVTCRSCVAETGVV